VFKGLKQFDLLKMSTVLFETVENYNNKRFYIT